MREVSLLACTLSGDQQVCFFGAFQNCKKHFHWPTILLMYSNIYVLAVGLD